MTKPTNRPAMIAVKRTRIFGPPTATANVGIANLNVAVFPQRARNFVTGLAVVDVDAPRAGQRQDGENKQEKTAISGHARGHSESVAFDCHGFSTYSCTPNALAAEMLRP